MTTNKKKNKYEELKGIELIDDRDVYNEIGYDDHETTGRAYIASKTRQNAALTRESTSNIKIDDKKITAKKTITVPETKPDDTYYDLIKNKRDFVAELHNQRGYWRVYLDDHLPNPDAYDCTDRDLEALAEINAKYQGSHQVRPEDFERLVELWETEIGHAAIAEKKRLGTCPVEVNRIDLDRAKAVARDCKELAPFCKSLSFQVVIADLHRVGAANSVLGRDAKRDQPPVPAALLEELPAH